MFFLINFLETYAHSITLFISISFMIRYYSPYNFKKLENLIKKLKKDNQDKSISLDDLTAKNDSLNDKVSILQQTVSEMEKNINELISKIEHSKVLLNERDSKIIKLEQELNIYKFRREPMQEEPEENTEIENEEHEQTDNKSYLNLFSIENIAYCIGKLDDDEKLTNQKLRRKIRFFLKIPDWFVEDKIEYYINYAINKIRNSEKYRDILKLERIGNSNYKYSKNTKYKYPQNYKTYQQIFPQTSL